VVLPGQNPRTRYQPLDKSRARYYDTLFPTDRTADISRRKYLEAVRSYEAGGQIITVESLQKENKRRENFFAIVMREKNIFPSEGAAKVYYQQHLSRGRWKKPEVVARVAAELNIQEQFLQRVLNSPAIMTAPRT
jgi:hypothetical protein